MLRNFSIVLAGLAAAVSLASAVQAGPKAGASCCGGKHPYDLYVSCCEVGNKGFFKKAACGSCCAASKTAKAEHKASKK